MSITLFDELGNAITEEIAYIIGEFDKAAQMIKEFSDKITEELAIDYDEKAFEAQERRWARLLAAQKEAARARAYGLRMLLEKAHRALKWRKRLHDDGVPDGERQAIR